MATNTREPSKNRLPGRLTPFCIALALGATWCPALGQVLPGAVEPGRDRPLPQPPAQPDFDFSIEAPRRSAVPRAVDEVHFNLTNIEIVGAKSLPASQFRPLYQNLLGKDVTLGDILDVADKIEQAYRDAGFLLVRAFVPPQRVANGIFTISVTEGFVSTVSIEGGDATTAARVRSYLGNVTADRPLRLGTMERGLLLANDLPGVTAAGILRPSPDTPGASDLVVTVTQPPVTGGLAIDNRGSHFSGLYTVTGDISLNSPLGLGDQLTAVVSTSPSSFERVMGQLRYRVPVGDDGLVASASGTFSHGEPGSTLAAFNVFTNSWAVGPRLSYPVLRTRAESLIVDGGFTVQDAKVRILGAPFSHDQWRVADISVNYVLNGVGGGSFVATGDLAQGLDVLGATANGSPDLSRAGSNTDFTKLVGALRFTRPLDGPLSLALSAQAQYAFNEVVTGEEITFGGSQIGRGYDPGAITGDHGLGGSAELRYDGRISDSVIQAYQPYAFFEAAEVWNTSSAGGGSATIESVGGGVRFWMINNITLGVEAARTLESVPGSDSGSTATKVLVNAGIRF